MRIAHISDLHIRNRGKFREEYRAAFKDLYRQLRDLKPEVVINTGDTVHQKLDISPELVEDVKEHVKAVCNICDYWIILGNHDLNLKNRRRPDALTPIIEDTWTQGGICNVLKEGKMMITSGLVLHGKGDGEKGFYDSHPWMNFEFWVYDIRQREHSFPVNPERINIGLYHGAINGCKNDIGYELEGGTPLSTFDQMDFVMMGDIHRRQSFRDGRMWYPGSLIQQNYGESLPKGFLMWDIRSKTDFEVTFHPVTTHGRFYTVQVPASLDLNGVDVPQGSRVRALVDGEISPSQKWELDRQFRERFGAVEFIANDTRERSPSQSVSTEQLIGSRESLMREYLTEKAVDDRTLESVMGLFSSYDVEDEDAAVRGTSWKLKAFGWNNMMNFGEGNIMDLTRLHGLVGVFAPNAAGKSSIFDIMLQALFDKLTKEVPRNVDLINDNFDSATMSVEFESSGKTYSIERSLERLKYGQRKLPEVKQWGRTSLDFSVDGNSLNGATRPETERAIKQIIGRFEDFVLTSMVSQGPIAGVVGDADLLGCKESDRRKILFRFLDLDVFERVHAKAKEDLKALTSGLKGKDRKTLETDLSQMRERRARTVDLVEGLKVVVKELEEKLEDDNYGIASYQLQASEKQVEALRSRLGSLQRSVSETNMLLRDHDEKRPKTPTIPLDELLIEIERSSALRESTSATLVKLRTEHKAGIRSLDDLIGIPCDGKYPTCKFISKAVDFSTRQAEVESAIADLAARHGELAGRLAELDCWQLVHEDVARWERELIDLTDEHDDLVEDVGRVEGELRVAEAALADSQANLDRITTNIHDGTPGYPSVT